MSATSKALAGAASGAGAALVAAVADGRVTTVEILSVVAGALIGYGGVYSAPANRDRRSAGSDTDVSH